MTAVRQARDPALDAPDRLHWLALDQLQGIGLLTFDLQLRFASASGAALAACGVMPADLIGKRPSEIAGGRWAPLEAYFAEALSGRRDASMPVPWVPVPGIDFTANICPVRDLDETIIGGFLGLRASDAETD